MSYRALQYVGGAEPGRVRKKVKPMLSTLPTEAQVLARLIAWGEAEPALRAMLMTSSRARPDNSADALSDYDIIAVLTEPEP